MAAIAESEVFESGDEDEESRVLWQIMMIEEAAREAAARQRAEAANTAKAAMETTETKESTEPAETPESTETQSSTEAPAEFAETPETAEAVESTEESTQAAEVAVAEVAVVEVAVAETATEESAKEESAESSAEVESAETKSAEAEKAEAESAEAERVVVGGAEAESAVAEVESAVVVTPTATAIVSDTGATAIAPAPSAETAESLNAPSSSSNGGGVGGGIRKSTSASGLFSLESATGTTPNSDTVTPVSTSTGAAPHKDAARAANSGGTISKSTSTGALSSLISARSFRIRGKSSGGGLPFLPALTVPESDPAASADHGPLSCSALPLRSPDCPQRGHRPPAHALPSLLKMQHTIPNPIRLVPIPNHHLSSPWLLCIVLCFASAHAQAPAKPTKAQIKAELQKMANAITKKFPQYAKYAKDINKYIGLALNSKYDFTALSDATLLLPSDTEAEALAKKVPVNKANIPRIYNITAYHIIRKKYTVPALKVLKKSQPIGTQLKQAMYKVSQQKW
ncbi:unnamed protein product [Closterium sp. NIES-64]|nr:unnamed protein product [Closterium sp. NIES-64]